MMLSFDGYSFCKPHSASYARVSLQAAWLKTHFPAEFMAAVISNGGGYYSTFAYVSEARRLGLSIRRPDVRTSSIRWTGEGPDHPGRAAGGARSRPPDHAADRRGEKAAALLRRLPISAAGFAPSADEARSLIDAGAMDGLENGSPRSGLHWQFASS